MSALWISHVIVTDEVAYAEYAKRASTAIAAHGGVFLARGGRTVHFEGKPYPRNVVVRFDSLAAAEACYTSDAYQHALAFAKDASERQLSIVEELA